MSTPVLGYTFHCGHCKHLLAIRCDSDKIKEVERDGDVLIWCPNCKTSFIYEKRDFFTKRNISDWDDYFVIR